jgi:hypothetical protein
MGEAEVEAQLAARSASRARKDFAEADRLRSLLEEAGVVGILRRSAAIRWAGSGGSAPKLVRLGALLDALQLWRSESMEETTELIASWLVGPSRGR